MVLSWKRCLEITLVACLVFDIAKSCDKDSHCKPHQVCCGKRCRSWPKCFLNSDKECYYDTHCIKGAVCVSNVCKPRKLLPTSCKTHDDCDIRNNSRSHDEGDVSHVKCCQGKCLDMKNCLRLLKINSTLTTPTTSRAIRGPCLETVDCTSGLECMDGKCTTKITDHTDELRNSTLLSYKRGILSAVILIGVFFLVLIAYCCIKETKYSQKYCPSQRQGDDPALSNHSSSHQVRNLSTVHMHTSASRNSHHNRFTASWLFSPGLYGLNQTSDRNCEQQEDCNSSCTGPPSYRSVCFDHELPPSYDEAMNCNCQNHHLHGSVQCTGINV